MRWDRAPGEPGRLRVTPQLIRVADDGHLWTTRYDAELVRVFEVQTSIAEQVTAALDVALGTPEREAIAIGGTADADAYDLYLRGNDYLARGYGQTTLASACQLYEQAVQRDPRFALAFARLANAHIQTYWFGHDRTEDRLALAKAAAESAAVLAPDLPEAQIALGYYHYRGFRDYERALQHFEAARRHHPATAELLAAIAAVERRRGNWDAAIAGYAEALRYDPRSNIRAYDVGSSLNMVRRFAEAEEALDRSITLAPDWPQPYAEKAQTYLAWRGDLAAARAALGEALSRTGIGPVGPSLATNDQTIGSVFTSDSASAPLVDAHAAPVQGRQHPVLLHQGRARGVPEPARRRAGLRRLATAGAGGPASRDARCSLPVELAGHRVRGARPPGGGNPRRRTLGRAAAAVPRRSGRAVCRRGAGPNVHARRPAEPRRGDACGPARDPVADHP
ncbi:MAG: hypothetical protein ACREOF_07585 [Gemmatimonadales bacterium]